MEGARTHAKHFKPRLEGGLGGRRRMIAAKDPVSAGRAQHPTAANHYVSSRLVARMHPPGSRPRRPYPLTGCPNTSISTSRKTSSVCLISQARSAIEAATSSA